MQVHVARRGGGGRGAGGGGASKAVATGGPARWISQEPGSSNGARKRVPPQMRAPGFVLSVRVTGVSTGGRFHCRAERAAAECGSVGGSTFSSRAIGAPAGPGDLGVRQPHLVRALSSVSRCVLSV